jgi:DeoR/GlpR family transcriptional regulator of sugar metabolism
MELLMQTGSASVEEIASRFDVSKMTVHRDLDQLEEDKLLRKVRGGATVQSSSQFESDFLYRARLAKEEKQRIAAATAEMVEPGQVIILDDGSTIAEMVPFLIHLRPLTVITNNASIISSLIEVEAVKLIALGGDYVRRYHGFFGLMTQESLRSIRADQAFISTSSIADGAAFHQDQLITQTKRAIMDAADRLHLLADHSKFNRTALHMLCRIERFETVITGEDPGQRARAGIVDAGAKLEIVPDKGAA